MHSGVTSKRYVWLSVGSATCLLLSLSLLLSYAQAAALVVLLIGAVFVVPWMLHQSDLMSRRRYNEWRAGHLPHRRSKSRRWWQLSIRATLLLTTVCALFVSSLRADSLVSGFFVGAGCVLGGILIGLDYEPRGFGALKGQPLSAAVGGIVGTCVLVCFIIGVQITTSQSWPQAWLWRSIGRLVLVWLCVGTFGGAAAGMWKATQPFRTLPALDPLAKPRTLFDAATPDATEHTSFLHLTPQSNGVLCTRDSSTRRMDLLPAILASVLVHMTFISVQAGMFDIGSKTDSRQGKSTMAEIQIIATFDAPVEEADPDLNPVQFELHEDLASDATDETAAAPEPSDEIEDEETIESTAKIVDALAEPTDQVTEGGQGTLGAADQSFEIPLDGQTVRLRTRIGSWKLTGVSRLKLISDGNRIRVDADVTGTLSAVELPLQLMSVEFESPDLANAKLLGAKPFVRVGRSISSRTPDVGEAKVEILNPTNGYAFTQGPVRRTPTGLLPMRPSLIQTTPERPVGSRRATNEDKTGMDRSNRNEGLTADAAKPTVGQVVDVAEPDKGLLFEGRCPVLLIEQAKWKKGEKEHIHKGWTIRFSSEPALQKFKKDPSRYLPQFNGQDVVALLDKSQSIAGHRRFGVLFDDDGAGPNLSRIYLFANPENRSLFEANPDRYLAAVKGAKPSTAMSTRSRTDIRSK